MTLDLRTPWTVADADVEYVAAETAVDVAALAIVVDVADQLIVEVVAVVTFAVVSDRGRGRGDFGDRGRGRGDFGGGRGGYRGGGGGYGGDRGRGGGDGGESFLLSTRCLSDIVLQVGATVLVRQSVSLDSHCGCGTELIAFRFCS